MFILIFTYFHFLFRYKAFDKLAEEIIGMMRAAIGQGQTNHKVSVEGAVKQCDLHVSVAPKYVTFCSRFLYFKVLTLDTANPTP